MKTMIPIRRFNQIAMFSLCLCILFFSGCASHPQNKPDSDWVGYRESGTASYYGKKYHGRKTASGERFNQYAMTAAHKKLPFGTKVEVTNLENSRKVTVTINDRGPFVKGRIIDLSRSAFAKVGNLKSGLLKVKIRVVK